VLYLSAFGNNVEGARGRLRFPLWYLVGGLATTSTQTWVAVHYAGLEAAGTSTVYLLAKRPPPRRYR
jgi:membrane associated rhomboid family serine protease